MAAADYQTCEDGVLASEGGYTNDPRDPGGPTNWGITIYDARLYWKRDATAGDVKAMPRTVACDIYRKKYWDALAGDALPAGLDYTVFDYGVNSGIARSGKVLRRCLALPSADWHVTADVLAAVAAHDVKTLIGDINAERLHFLQGLSTWSHFGAGWSARVHRVDVDSLRLAAAPAETHVAVAQPAVPRAKAAESATDLFAHLSAGESWAALWHDVSAMTGLADV